MRLVVKLAVLTFAAAGLAAPATAAEVPKNPWPAKKVRVAFYVDTVTASPNESVWGKWAPQRCTQTNFFARGEGVVFHVSAVDARTGKVLEDSDVRYAYLKIPGEPNLPLKFGPHGRDPATAPWYWAARWDVRPDYALGTVPFEVVVKLKDMKRNEIAVWKQYSNALAQLSIIATR